MTNAMDNPDAHVLPFIRRDRTRLVREGWVGPLADVPPDRPIDELLQGAFVNLDKPAGLTSRDASDRVARILGCRGTGHSGTLDPKVTGVLPVAMGRARKVLEVLLKGGKEYEGVMAIHGKVAPEVLEEAVARHRGSIEQLPPVRSRVVRRLRRRDVYYFDLLEVGSRRARFRVGVEAGTYIRKLVHDLGQDLGCGAHMAALRRTRAGPFTDDRACDPAVLEAAFDAFGQGDDGPLSALLHPPESALAVLGRVWMDTGALPRIRNGSPLFAPGVLAAEAAVVPGETVAMLTPDGRAHGLGRADMTAKAMVTTASGTAVATRKVLG